MGKTLLYFENKNDYEQARNCLESRGAMLAAVPPYLIESSLRNNDLVALQIKGAKPLSKNDLSSLPFGVQLAAKAFMQKLSSTASLHHRPILGHHSLQGISWETPGLEAPGHISIND